MDDSGAAKGRNRGVLWLVGASSGIGRCLAQQLVAAGWQVAASARRAGKLEALVDAAGQREFDAALFRRLVEVNYMGAVHCLDALLPLLRERGRGQVLLTASVAGYRGLPLAAPYSASKAALINLGEALQPELASAGVRMRVINPGFVDTQLTSKNRFGMPFLMTADQAARRIVNQLDRKGFEIAFPRRFVWQLKLLRCLPYGAYFPLVKWMTRT